MPSRSASCAKSPHQKDDKANEENKADPASSDSGPAKIKAAATEQEKKHDHEEHEVHGPIVTKRRDGYYGVFKASNCLGRRSRLESLRALGGLTRRALSHPLSAP